jgi:hypothetical protein
MRHFARQICREPVKSGSLRDSGQAEGIRKNACVFRGLLSEMSYSANEIFSIDGRHDISSNG